MILLILCFFSLQFSLLSLPVDQKYVDSFKQLKPDDHAFKFYIFVHQVKKAGFVPGDCIETFVEQKKTMALSALYTNDELQLLQKKLEEAKKTRESSGLVLQYRDDVPQDIRDMVFTIAQEGQICGNIFVGITENKSYVSIVDEGDPRSKRVALFNLLFRENGALFKNTYYLNLKKEDFITNKCNESMRHVLRHELIHIDQDHLSIRLFHTIFNKKRGIDPKFQPNSEQRLKLYRSHETEADLIPVAYTPLSNSIDYENLTDSLRENPLKEHDKEKSKHPSDWKRAQRATVIRRIKETELFYDDPFGYISNKIYTSLTQYKYINSLILGIKKCFL